MDINLLPKILVNGSNYNEKANIVRSDFVQLMRKKEQVSYPLHQEKTNVSNATMISTFQPETELEAEIENILKVQYKHCKFME